MKRLTSVITALGLTSLAVAGLPLQARSAHLALFGLAEAPVTARQMIAQRSDDNRSDDDRSWWQTLIDGERGDGGRNPFAEKYLNERLCVVSPNNISIGSWSDRPLFVWLDKDDIIKRFEVYDADIAAPIWSDDVGEGTEDGWHVMELTTLTFEPGKTYHFALRQAGEEGHANPADRAKFGVYSAEEVAPVSAALEAAGLTGHEANLETLRFFADQSGNRKLKEPIYFLDFVRVLFSMPASAERSTYINEIVNTYCKPSAEETSTTPLG